MAESLDKLLIILCEKLPLNFTFYEEKGLCDKPNESCKYCRKNADDVYLCYKKTYIFSELLGFI